MSHKNFLEAMRAVEAEHFRTNSDTGAAGQAMVVWNELRQQLGMPPLRRDDLPSYNQDAKRYEMPLESNLLTNERVHDPLQHHMYAVQPEDRAQSAQERLSCIPGLLRREFVVLRNVMHTIESLMGEQGVLEQMVRETETPSAQ